MRRLAGLEGLKPALFDKPVATIGVFDGMHRGHRHVIEHLRAMADQHGGDAVVVTFDTHPRAVIAGAAPRQILSVPHRLLLLERNGIDAAVVLPFDARLREMTYEQFTRTVLLDGMGIRGLLFGYNTTFGKKGAGDFEHVKPLGEELGFEVKQAPPIALEGKPISASRIRDAIETGDLKVAEEMLGRPVAIYGLVVKGDGRGRTLGFPTANVDPEGEILPPTAVYQVVATVRGERYAAVANFGTRPTFEEKSPVPVRLLEVERGKVDFEFYGERIEVEIVRKLRDERPFPSKEALIAQIRADVASLGLGS